MLRVLFMLFALFATALPAAGQTMGAPDTPVVVHVAPPPTPADWEQVNRGFVRVTGPADSLPFLMEMAEEADAAIPELADALGVPIGGTIHVVIAPDDAAFHALQPGRVPEWADGTAWPDAGHIYLRRPRTRTSLRPIEQVLRHEIVHVLLGRAFAPAHPPRWLQEGTATVLSGEYGPDMSRTLIQAVALGHRPSLSAIADGFPSSPSRAQLAYAESADFISWMQGTYGEDSIQKLVLESARGNSLAASFRAVTGEFLDDVEPQWRQRLTNADLQWATLLTSWEMWTGVAGGVAVFGLIFARRRSRSRLEQMKEDEARMDALIRRLWSDGPTVH